MLVVACSGDGGTGGGKKPGIEDDSGAGGDGDQQNMNTGDGDLDGDGDGNGDGDGDREGCKAACDPDDCGGAVYDLCGGFLDCGGCSDGKICGVKREDKCDFPDPENCTPTDAAVACENKCGPVPDGCSGVINCDGTNGGLDCTGGQYCQNEVCVTPAPGCVAKTAAEVCTPAAGLPKCGLQSDGCDGVIDCEANGGLQCDDGDKCAANGTSCEPLPAPECTNRLTACPAGTSGEVACGAMPDNCGDFIACAVTADACGAGKTCKNNLCQTSATTCTKFTAAQACAGNKCGHVPDNCGGTIDCSSATGVAAGGDACTPGVEICDHGQCTAPVCTPTTPPQSACPTSATAKSCGTVSIGCGQTYNCGTCDPGQNCGNGGANLCGAVATGCVPKTRAEMCAGKCGIVPTGCGTNTYNCSDGAGVGVVCSGMESCGGGGTANTCGVPAGSTCTPKTCADYGHTCGSATDGCGKVLDCWPAGQPKQCSSDLARCIADATTGKQSCVTGTVTCTGPLCTNIPPNCDTTTIRGKVVTPGYNGKNRLPVPNAIVYIPASATTALPAVYEGVKDEAASCGRCADEKTKLVAAGQSVLVSANTNEKGEFELKGRIPVGAAFKLVIKIGKWRTVIPISSGNVQACQTWAPATPFALTSAHYRAGASIDAGNHLPKIAVSTGEVDEMECVLRNMGIAESEFTIPTGNGRVSMYRANGARMGTQTSTTTYSCRGSNWRCALPGSNSASACPAAHSSCSWQATVNTTWNDQSVADTGLTASQAAINAYDMVVYDCEGGEYWESDTREGYVRNYVDKGGRMFASHYSYIWIEDNGTLDQSAAWGVTGSDNSDEGMVSMPVPPVTNPVTPNPTTMRTGANAVKSPLFRDWLYWQGALKDAANPPTTAMPAIPRFDVTDARDRAGNTVGASTDEWLYRDTRACSKTPSFSCDDNDDCPGEVCSQLSHGAQIACDDNDDCPGSGNTCTAVSSNTCAAATVARVQQLSFNTPYGATEANQCGRVAYSGFHVSSTDNGDNDDYFPGVCEDRDLTAQEKTLAFMLFDLAACQSDGDQAEPPECIAKTAAQLCTNLTCGFLPDGCGGVVDCEGCPSGYLCSGTSCIQQTCTAATCNTYGFNCGDYSDGCGGTMHCGTCTGNQQCGLREPGRCGAPDCTKIPQNTACPANSCGYASDGCGGVYQCGTCPAGQVCGAGGTNKCGAGSCTKTPQATACAGKNCGEVSDGCGGTYTCGTCTNAADSCGGAGTPNVCGHPVCDKFTKEQACASLVPPGTPANLICGYASDGCGGVYDCGTCADGRVCGGGGANVCGDICEPVKCDDPGIDAECGAISDGCGSIIQCGQCEPGETCGAGGPNKCGTGQTCVARNCTTAQAECGLVGDGCGKVLDCGPCTTPGETCGGAGVPNECGIGMGGCNPQTCMAKGVQCGATSNGCGGLLDCGGCPVKHACVKGVCEEITILE